LDDSPRRIHTFLDQSASMAYKPSVEDPWRNAVQLTRLFLEQLEKNEEVSLNVFAEKSAEMVALTSDRGSIEAALNHLPRPITRDARKSVGYYTRAQLAVRQKLKSDGFAPQFGESIVLFTDGYLGDEDSAARRDAAATGVRVFILFTNPPDVRYVNYRRGITIGNLRRGDGNPGSNLFLEADQLAGETGGIVFDPWHSVVTYVSGDIPSMLPEGFERRVQSLYSSIRRVYRVELELQEPLTKPRSFRLELLDTNGKSLRNVTIVHPRHLGAD
jgi:hypothetical protein